MSVNLIQMKEEVDFEIKIESDSCQDYNEAPQKQFVELNKNYNLHVNEVDGGNDSVPVEWSTIYPKIEDEEDYLAENEEKIKTESYSYQEGECNEDSQENIVKSVDGITRLIIKYEDEIESVPIDYKQVDPKMEDEIEIEENVKLQIDSYQGESQEALDEQLVKVEENIDNKVVERIKETEKKCKRIATDSRKRIFNIKTHQHSSNSFRKEEKERTSVFPCSICPKENNDAATLKRHMFLHLKEAENTHELFSLKICDKLGLKSKILATIKGKEYHFDVYKCGECEYIASNAFHLKYHIRKRHSNVNVNNSFKEEITSMDLNEPIVKCQLYESEANQKSDLDNHLSCKNLKERNFECNFCDYTTNLKSNLNSHQRSVHLNERKFQCNLCEYKTSRKSVLTEHVSSVHLKERKFKCHLCEYKSNRKSQVDKHFRLVHLKERNCECNLCDYKCYSKSHLNNHINSVHLKQRRFECSLCDYRVYHKSTLNNHFRSVHLNERQFQCNLCDYRANLKSTLDTHWWIVHLNERKFKCKLCEYKAGRKCDLAKHVNSVHLKKRIFQCHLCEYKANKKSQLSMHFKLIHLIGRKFE